MRKLKDGSYKLSETDKKQIAARTRAIAAEHTRKRQFDGCIEAWFDTETGQIHGTYRR